MFPVFPKNLSFLPSYCSFFSSHFRTLLIRFPMREFSSSSSSHPQPHCKQFKEENVRVSVWWNFDNCGASSGFSVWKIAPSIIGAVRANGIKGPIDIRAYGDISRFSIFQRTALFLTGIHLRHITPGGKRKAYDHLLIDLLTWSSKNPPPVHLCLISDDGDLSGSDLWVLHRLRNRNYNILVACPGRASDGICSTTTILWSWSSILKGEDLNGKYFNCLPDGPFDSWYGDSKVPLENPISAIEESTSFQNALIDKPTNFPLR